MSKKISKTKSKTSKSKTKKPVIQNKVIDKIKTEIQPAGEIKLKTEVPAAANSDLKLNSSSNSDLNLNSDTDNILDRFPKIGKRIKSSFAKMALKMGISQEELLKLCVQAANKKKIQFEKKTVYVTK